jgi:hypothetical protein
MTYDSPITCSTGNTSTISIEDAIPSSYITGCKDHYVLVNDSISRILCGMYKNYISQTKTKSKIRIHTLTNMKVAIQ